MWSSLLVWMRCCGGEFLYFGRRFRLLALLCSDVVTLVVVWVLELILVIYGHVLITISALLMVVFWQCKNSDGFLNQNWRETPFPNFFCLVWYIKLEITHFNTWCCISNAQLVQIGLGGESVAVILHRNPCDRLSPQNLTPPESFHCEWL